MRARGPKEGPTMKKNIKTNQGKKSMKSRPSPTQNVARCSEPSRVRCAGADAPPLTAPARRALPKAGEGQTVSPTEALGSGCGSAPEMTIGLDLGDRFSRYV